MLWLDSQVLVFGSWEEREHGPSHSLGKRCLPSWVALALPTEVDTHVDRQTDRQTHKPVFAPFGKEAPKMLHTYTAAPAVWCFYS